METYRSIGQFSPDVEEWSTCIYKTVGTLLAANDIHRHGRQRK